MKPALAWTLRIIPAILIGQSLPFKFSGAAESVALFTDLATKAFGNPELEGALRIGTGVIELVAVILLLIPNHSLKGALIVVGTMAGALMSHLLFIGFAQHGPLSVMALIALLASAYYLFKSKTELSQLLGSLQKRPNPLQQ